MRKGEAKDFLPLLQALVDGKTIQFSLIDGDFKDCNWSSFSFDAKPERYRIKPEPIEIWCMIDSNKDLIAKSFRNCDDCQNWIDELNKKHNGDYLDYKPVLFRQAMHGEK